MFKEIISSLTQKTLNSANTASGHIADSLVGNLKNRSPLLGHLAGKYLDNKRATAQFGRDQIHAARIYASENVDKDFGQEVKKENKDLNPQDLAKKMEEILSKLQKVSDKSPDKLEADPLYKKYGKFFKENEKQFKASRETKPTGSKSDTPADNSDIIAKLDSIEANTAETAKQIANLTKNKETDQEEPNTQGPVVEELKKISKFLEIQAHTDKLAAIQAAEDRNEALDVKKDPSVLKSLMAKLNGKDSYGPESNRGPSLLDKVKGLVLGRTTTNTNKPGTLRDGLRNTAKTKAKIPTGPSKLSGAVKSVGSLGARALSGLGAFAANPLVLGTAAVAGAAGYAAGSLINDKLLTEEDGSNKIGSWLYDKFGNSENDAKVAEKKAAQDLYEKRVVEGKLTSKSAVYFEQQGIKVDKSKIVDMPTPVKSSVTGAVASKVATQESLANKPPASTQPIILNNNTSTSSGSSGIQMITGVNVRNSDTTFERVQMQDFWPRTE